MRRKILGLDIRHDAVSAVLLKSGIKGTVIDAHVHVPLSDRKEDETGWVEPLETLVKKMDISGSVCAASFPADEISYRNIQVPFKGQKKIKKILPYELEPTFPFPTDDLIIDFIPVKLPDHINDNNLITAAVEKSKLQSFLDTLAMFNIAPETVTVGGYPAALCLTHILDNRKNWLVVDIDSNKGAIFFILSGTVCLIRSFLIRLDARSYKIKSLCSTIRQTHAALEKMIGLEFDPDGLFITGCGLDDLGFEQDMAQALGLPVERIDLLRDTDLLKHQDPPESWVPFLMDNALSLALMEVEGVNGFNFRKGPFASKKFWEENKKGLIQTGVFFALVVALAFFNVFIDSYFMGKRLARLDNQITDIFTSTFPDVKKIVDPVQQMRIKIQAARKKMLFPGETEKSIRTIDILNNISNRIPRETDVTLTRMVIGSENVVISGDTDTFNSVDNIKSRLEQEDAFKKIIISSANINKSDNRVHFNLKITF
jgi:type II secretion system protein L